MCQRQGGVWSPSSSASAHPLVTALRAPKGRLAGKVWPVARRGLSAANARGLQVENNKILHLSAVALRPHNTASRACTPPHR